MRVEEDPENENDQRHRGEREMMPGPHSSVEEHGFDFPPELQRGIERLHSWKSML